MNGWKDGGINEHLIEQLEGLVEGQFKISNVSGTQGG